MMRKFLDGILAGILICIGGGIFLNCENRIVGAVLFSIALLCICIRSYNLYTGKICYILANKDFGLLFLGLFGNIISTFAGGKLLAYAVPSMKDVAFNICTGKFSQAMPMTFIRAMFCGMLIYLAVDIYKKEKNIVGILFAIPVFILSGYEHSIADMFYFAASGIISSKVFVFIMIVLLGNSVGGLIFPLLEAKEKK